MNVVDIVSGLKFALDNARKHIRYYTKYRGLPMTSIDQSLLNDEFVKIHIDLNCDGLLISDRVTNQQT